MKCESSRDEARHDHTPLNENSAGQFGSGGVLLRNLRFGKN